MKIVGDNDGGLPVDERAAQDQVLVAGPGAIFFCQSVPRNPAGYQIADTGFPFAEPVARPATAGNYDRVDTAFLEQLQGTIEPAAEGGRWRAIVLGGTHNEGHVSAAKSS